LSDSENVTPTEKGVATLEDKDIPKEKGLALSKDTSDLLDTPKGGKGTREVGSAKRGAPLTVQRVPKSPLPASKPFIQKPAASLDSTKEFSKTELTGTLSWGLSGFVEAHFELWVHLVKDVSADTIIAALANRCHTEWKVPCLVVSNDTNFLQITERYKVYHVGTNGKPVRENDLQDEQWLFGTAFWGY
jgi:hypothetical protein